MKHSFVALAVALLVLAIYWMARERATGEIDAPSQRSVEPDRGAEQTLAVHAGDAPAASERTAVAAAAAVPARALTTVRGRCVDPSGRPLAAVRAHLMGRAANEIRMDAWSKDNEVPVPIDMQVTTGADGVFAFSFWPPPPFQFFLALNAPGAAGKHGRWGEFMAGETKDLGDVVLEPGTRLRGRVRDSAGVPVANAPIHAVRAPGAAPAADDAMQSGGGASARTGADGSYQFGAILGRGEYRLQVAQRVVQQPKTLALDGSAPESVVDIVVDAIEEAATLAGVVVDDLGQPILGVRVSATSPGVEATTDRAGHFRLQRPPQGGADRVGIMLRCDGYEPVTAGEDYAWGRRDLRLRMRRGADVEILVVAADTGAPVEEFQVRVFPDPKVGAVSDARAYEVRARGTHAGGRAIVSGVTRGAHLVLVEPRGDAHAMSELVPLTVADGPNATTIRLAANAERPLHVRTTRGAPVAGTKVQLAFPLGGAVDAETMVSPITSLGRRHAANEAFLVHEATTDAEGHALLRAGRSLRPALLVLGPGHVPLIVPQVAVDAVEPMVVTVSEGARVTGKIGPPAVLAEFERLGGEFTRRARERGRRTSPHVVLQRADAGPGARQHPREAQPAVVGDDGTFDIVGAPPGTWAVCVEWPVALTAGIAGATSHRQKFASVELREGTTTTCDLDLSRLLPGEVEAVAWHNGVRLAGASLALQPQRVAGQDAAGSALQAQTDAGGRFHLRAAAGDYQVIWGGHGRGMFVASQPLTVSTGQTTAANVHFQTGTVRARVLDAGGAPVAKLALMLRDASGEHRRSLPPTDADGRTTAEIEVETFTALTLPERLLSPEAQRALSRTRDPNALSPWLDAGSVTAAAGATVDVELRLPPQFRQ